MEAVPKMPMLSFSLKQTLQKSSFSRLKQVSKAYVIFPNTKNTPPVKYCIRNDSSKACNKLSN